MKRSFKFACLSAAAVAAAGFVLTAGDAVAGMLSGRTVKIGALVPLTGKGAEWGQTAKKSMEIAQEEINAAGGIGGVKVKVIFYDTQSKEAEGIKLFKKLATRDKVLTITGPCFSSIYEVLAPQLERYKISMISYCSSKPGLSALSPWAFRNTLTSDKQLIPVVAAWVKEYKIGYILELHQPQSL